MEVISGLIVKIQNRLFEWFDFELKELCGINIITYPFDKENGYVIISEDNIEILLLEVERLLQMTEVIRKFVGNNQLKIINTNIGRDEEYSHIYEGVKKNLKLPSKYNNVTRCAK